MESEAEFWRSEKGMKRFERQLSTMLDSIFAGWHVHPVADVGFMRVHRCDGFAGDGLSTYSTSGLWVFLLEEHQAANGFVRTELAWTIESCTSQALVTSVLTGLANRILESRVAPVYDRKLAEIGDFWTGGEVLRRNLVAVERHWLPESASVEGFYPLAFAEIVALTNDEMAMLEREPDLFFRWASEAGLLDTSLGK